MPLATLQVEVVDKQNTARAVKDAKEQQASSERNAASGSDAIESTDGSHTNGSESLVQETASSQAAVPAAETASDSGPATAGSFEQSAATTESNSSEADSHWQGNEAASTHQEVSGADTYAEQRDGLEYPETDLEQQEPETQYYHDDYVATSHSEEAEQEQNGDAVATVENIDDPYDLLADAHEIVFSAAGEESTAGLQDETETLDEAEVIYDEEVLETFDELMQIIADQQDSGVEEEEYAQSLPLDVEVPKNTEGEVIIETAAFEEYLDGQPEIEETVNIETIEEHVNEQPLEQTFLELAAVLSESSEEQPIPENLLRALSDVEEVLQKHYYAAEESATAKPELTPEMIEKFIALLREIGCQNPKDALAGLVTRHGFEFLLQAMGYLSQLKNEEYREEFLPGMRVQITDDDNHVRLRVAKLLFGLIARTTHTQEPVG